MFFYCIESFELINLQTNVIYYKYHIKKLDMIKSTYNSCFFYNIESFELMNLQTNDIFILINDNFAIVKNEIIESIKIKTKFRKCFIINNSIKFNEIKIKFLIVTILVIIKQKKLRI